MQIPIKSIAKNRELNIVVTADTKEGKTLASHHPFYTKFSSRFSDVFLEYKNGTLPIG